MLKLDKYDSIETIKDFLNICKLDFCVEVDGLYHHNRSYNSIPGILDTGILSKRKQYELKGMEVPEVLVEIAKDERCANGLDYISLAQADMTDLYRNEDEFDVRNPHCVDILLPSTLNVQRHTINYGNEFLAKDVIDPSYFKSIDIRLINLIKKYEMGRNLYVTKEDSLNEIINNYNQLRCIASKMISNNMDIPLRDMSYYGFDLDKNLVSELPEIVLKK